MAKYTIYNPTVEAYQEVDSVVAEQFKTSAVKLKSDMDSHPADKYSVYNPVSEAYQEISAGEAVLFVNQNIQDIG